jgi:hypothetical protein
MIPKEKRESSGVTLCTAAFFLDNPWSHAHIRHAAVQQTKRSEASNGTQSKIAQQ